MTTSEKLRTSCLLCQCVRNGLRCLGLEGDGLSTGISNKAQLLTQPVSEKHVKHKNNST